MAMQLEASCPVLNGTCFPRLLWAGEGRVVSGVGERVMVQSQVNYIQLSVLNGELK